MSKQTPTRTHCKHSRPLPYYNPNMQDAPALEVYLAPLHHPTTPIHAVNHSYNLSFSSINIKMFSLFRHILCSKSGGGRHLFSSRKQILVIIILFLFYLLFYLFMQLFMYYYLFFGPDYNSATLNKESKSRKRFFIYFYLFIYL